MDNHARDQPVDGTDPEPFLAELVRFRSRREAHDHGLPLLAKGLDYWVFQEGGKFILKVRTEQADQALAELQRYTEESRRWPPKPFSIEWQQAGWTGLIFFALILGAFHWANARTNGALREMGVLTAHGIMEQGEFWRAVTALTLHADVGHLLGNLALGAYFGYFVTRYFGGGLGWLFILLSGILGNLLNALIYYPIDHRSIGASTAVFGALGLLAAYPFGQWRRFRSLWEARALLLPPLAGAVLLFAFLGIGGPRTDIFAHVWGLFAGALLSFLFAAVEPLKLKSPRIQPIFHAISLLILMTAWLLARQAASPA